MLAYRYPMEGMEIQNGAQLVVRDTQSAMFANEGKVALSRSYDDWQKIILKELLHVHPELERYVGHMDVWVWGHAMVRPTRGFIWGDARKKALKQHAPIFTAHSDMSGISIFEEAYTHGVRAAEGVLSHLDISYRSVL